MNTPLGQLPSTPTTRFQALVDNESLVGGQWTLHDARESNRGHALALGTFGVKSIGTLNPLLSHRGNTRAMRVERPVESGELHKHPNRELDPHNSKEVTYFFVVK